MKQHNNKWSEEWGEIHFPGDRDFAKLALAAFAYTSLHKPCTTISSSPLTENVFSCSSVTLDIHYCYVKGTTARGSKKSGELWKAFLVLARPTTGTEVRAVCFHNWNKGENGFVSVATLFYLTLPDSPSLCLKFNWFRGERLLCRVYWQLMVPIDAVSEVPGCSETSLETIIKTLDANVSPATVSPANVSPANVSPANARVGMWLPRQYQGSFLQ